MRLRSTQITSRPAEVCCIIERFASCHSISYIRRLVRCCTLPTYIAAGIESPPFQIEETGWGGFETEVRLNFHQDFYTKPENRTHFLQLLPYGDEAQQKKQNEENMVRSEFFDIVEFNEPTEACWDALTDPDQWPSPRKGRGKGKGKILGGGLNMERVGEGTVALPEIGSNGNIYSLELEQQIVDKLRKAEAEIEKLLAVEIQKGKDVHEKSMELRQG